MKRIFWSWSIRPSSSWDSQIRRKSFPYWRMAFHLRSSPLWILKSAGITTVIWACGFSFDFGMVKFPVFDDFGFPVTQRGKTRIPGLFFLGMPWLYQQRSGLLLGVGDDATCVAEEIFQRQ